MNFKINIILTALAFLLVSVFFQGTLDAQILSGKIIEFENTTQPLLEFWTLAEKIEEKEDELLAIPLWLGNREIIFYENRVSGNGTVTKKKIQDEEREVALKILNTKSGEVRIVKVKIAISSKDGLRVISPSEYKIDIDTPRTNGIRWNQWNTMYKISEPTDWIVIKNKYPQWKTEKGKKIVEERIYVPYGPDIHIPEMVDAGRQHLSWIVEKSFEDLRQKRVYSKAVPGQLIADVVALDLQIFRRLPLVEGIDMNEFGTDPQKSYERVLVLIGSNKEKAYYWTESRAGARGWLQFTPSTYKAMRKTYPTAQLLNDHKVGASDHVNSMKAAILLHDYNLAGLVNRFGPKILADPRLEEYLAAAYNGKPKWVTNSLRATISKGLPDWINALSATRKDYLGGLRSETKGYIEKIRYLQEHNLP